jgi:ABC-type dipeptide/oligopeptide/nickel transport system ATPase component
MEKNFSISNIMQPELDRIKIAVTKRDRDYVMVIDGEEGSGKSVLAQQIARELDPKFNIDNICFNADQFIAKLKGSAKNTCIILDEAYSSANSRASLTEVNRSLIGVATEMRQRNLYVIIVIPSFFDLDKYFALWRCRCLLHVYFGKDGSRGSYILFPKTAKKYLYLMGKKFYDYSKPKSPYPPCSFRNHYTVDEQEYRMKKAEAFKKRVVSNLAKRWKLQRDGLIKELYHNLNIRTSQFEKIFLKWGTKPIGMREIQRIVQFSDQIETYEEDEDKENSKK